MTWCIWPQIDLWYIANVFRWGFSVFVYVSSATTTSWIRTPLANCWQADPSSQVPGWEAGTTFDMGHCMASHGIAWHRMALHGIAHAAPYLLQLSPSCVASDWFLLLLTQSGVTFNIQRVDRIGYWNSGPVFFFERHNCSFLKQQFLRSKYVAPRLPSGGWLRSSRQRTLATSRGPSGHRDQERGGKSCRCHVDIIFGTYCNHIVIDGADLFDLYTIYEKNIYCFRFDLIRLLETFRVGQRWIIRLSPLSDLWNFKCFQRATAADISIRNEAVLDFKRNRLS